MFTNPLSLGYLWSKETRLITRKNYFAALAWISVIYLKKNAMQMMSCSAVIFTGDEFVTWLIEGCFGHVHWLDPCSILDFDVIPLVGDVSSMLSCCTPIDEDGSVVFSCLTKPIVSFHPLYYLIKDCIYLSRKTWTCEFCLIGMIANNIVDLLAKKGHRLEDDCAMFDTLHKDKKKIKE